MKKLSILFVPLLFLLFFCHSSQNQKKNKDQKSVSISRKFIGLRLQTKFIGSFIYYEDPESIMKELNLIQVNLINDTDSTVKFITQTAGPYINVVLNNEGYTLLGPKYHSNSTGGNLLYPGQIFSFPVIFSPNKNFDLKNLNQLKIGFILLSWEKSYKVFNQLPELFFTWKKTYENVIWSDPIDLSVNKQKNHDYLRIINDTTFSYSKHE
jgi:hypothetical protein